MLRGTVFVLLALLLVSVAGFAGDLSGQKAPDFTLKGIDAKKHQLKEYLKDGPVMLDFWATWCVPCKQALPHLDAIYNEYKDQGFTLIAISTDNTRSVNKVKPYAKSQKWEFPVLLDTDNQVLKRYRGISVPHTVLINQEGKVAKVWIGYHPGEEKEIKAEVEKLLAK